MTDTAVATAPPRAPLAFIDTETDGVHPDRQVWEVAVVRREPDGRETTLEAFIDIDLATADPFGLRVGRFYERHPIGRHLAFYERVLADPGAPQDVEPDLWTVGAAASRVAALTHGAHLVGAVPNFDAEVLDRLLRAHRLIPAWHYHLVDIENLAVGYLAGRSQGPRCTPPWKSQDLTEALGVEPSTEEERHTAMGDVRWAMRMYDAVLSVEPGALPT